MTVNKPITQQLFTVSPEDIKAELLAGLLAPQASISPKYLYDELGSRLFDVITELPEYYPTRTEAAIFSRYLPEIAQYTGPFNALIDLGAGNCSKAETLFRPFAIQQYVALDISADFLLAALTRLQTAYPDISMTGVGLDFSSQLQLPLSVEQRRAPRLVFYPGSSIGNFDPKAALKFLKRAHTASNGGALIIGVDLVKPVSVLEPAYDDPLQVTAAFNRNMLRHVNRLAGTNFNLAQWRHVAFFNEQASRIEMHLQALEKVSISWPGGQRTFDKGERIHTENSYKWRLDQFEAVLEKAGFRSVCYWTDDQEWFAVFAAKA